MISIGLIGKFEFQWGSLNSTGGSVESEKVLVVLYLAVGLTGDLAAENSVDVRTT